MHLLSSLSWLAIGANALSMDYSSGVDVAAEHKSGGSHKTNCPLSYGYYPNWGIYAKNVSVTQIPAHLFTHLSYAFADVSPKDGKVILSDTWADLQFLYPGDVKTAKGNNLYGNLKQLYLLKKKYRHLNTCLAVGGATYSGNITAMLPSPAKRETFARSAANLAGQLGFDCVEIDYEHVKNKDEAENIVDLLKRLRAALDKLEIESKATARFLIGYATPAGKDNYKLLDFPRMNPYVDIFNFMAVDYAGATWSKKSGFLDNLYPSKKNPAATEFNTNSGIHDYLHEYKVPSHKIVLQNPLYGRAFAQTKGIGKDFKGPGKDGSLGQEGIWFYKDLPPKGYNLKSTNDLEAVGSYSYDKAKKYLIAYDTAEIVRAKVEYVKQKKLAGTSFWEVTQDREHSNDANYPSLIATAIEAYGGPNALDKRMNNLNYPLSQYDNLKNQMK